MEKWIYGRTPIKLCMLLATTVLGGTIGSQAYAQDKDAQSSDGLGDIVITAQKRETKLQDTGAAISAIDGSVIASTRIDNLIDSQGQTPNLIVSSNAALGQPYIRGVGNETIAGLNDAAVAVHFNGVYIARGSSILSDFYDIERVEVLRGPQGTLYGRNATGGVISIISKKPGKDLGGYVHFTLGNYADKRVDGALNIPLGSILSFRVAGLGEWRNGFQHNIFNGNDLYDKKLAAGRATLRADLGAWTVDLVGDLSRDTSSGIATRELSGDPAKAPALSLGGFTPARFFDVNVDTDSASRVTSDGLSLNIGWQGATNNFSSITGLRRSTFRIRLDQDATQVPLVVGDPEFQRSTTFSQEFQFGGRTGAFRYMAGVYYFHERAQDGATFKLPLNALAIVIDARGTTEALGAFANAEIDLTSQLRLIGGARYSHEAKEALTNVAFGASPVAIPQKRSWGSFTPRVGLEFRPQKDVLLFATVSKGFKSGGINTFSTTGELFDPETLWSYEAGLKAEWLDRRLRTNLSVFHYDYTNMQVQETSGLGVTSVRNAGKARINGVEFELAAAVAKDLEIGGNLSFLDAKFSRFLTLDPDDPVPGVQDLSGNRLPRAPEWSGFVYAQYRAKFADASAISARVEYRWQDDIFYSAFNHPIVGQSAYGLINTSLEYTFAGDRVTLGVWARNLAGIKYYQFAASSPGLNGVQGFPGTPRTFGATLGFKF